MLAIMQTNFNGIDGLVYRDIPQPQLTNHGVLIKVTTLPVVPTDWKRETNAHATSEQLTSLPRTIGIGAVGQVVAVGRDRDAALLHQRVLVMNPTGSYSAYLLSENPAFIFPLPDDVSDESAAALTAGPGTALALKEAIAQHSATNIIITGANSVIGLYLLQMLRPTTRHLYPVVSPSSQAYFHEQLPALTSYTPETLPQLDNPLIIDIAGNSALLDALTTHCGHASIVSIALMTYDPHTPFQFVHEEFDPAHYQTFIRQLATHDLIAPIDRIFPVTQTKEAQHYAHDSHSRGRVLVTFNH